MTMADRRSPEAPTGADAPARRGLDRVVSWLFVPATRPDRVVKAAASAAHAVVVDLEDSVPADGKDAAREALPATLAAAPRERGLTTVRVNAPETPAGAADLALVASLPIDAVLVPKATPRALDALPDGLPPVVAIVETAAGVVALERIAADARVVALMHGAVDLTAELGLRLGPEALELLAVRSSLVLHAAAAGLPAPIDGVYTDVRDGDGLTREARRRRAEGFGAKACIHPAQLDLVHAAFAPDEAELAWARRVLDAFEAARAAGHGSVALDGEMIDLPVAERARRLLAEGDR